MLISARRFCRNLLLAALFLAGHAPAETYHNWCALHFDATQIAAGLASPLRDVDHDGTDNVIEYLGDTDPWNANSRLKIELGLAPETVVFSVALDREDVVYEVVVSPDLRSWSEDAVQLCAGAQVSWHLNGYPYVKVGVKRRVGFMLDSDQDGLDDYFEESLVALNSGDALTHIGEVLATGDFDHNGVVNLDETANAAEPMPGGSYAPPALIDAAALNCALDSIPPPAPATLEVRTPLR